MRRELRAAAVAVVALTLLLGVAYPLLVTGAAQVAFPGRAGGSLLHRDGRVVGSRLLAQAVAGDRYFLPRPSTATHYDAAATAFTNLGPNSRRARDTFRASLRRYLARERRYDPGLTAAQVPADAVTSSASGVDPDISEANAAIQAHRVAAVRGLPLRQVMALIRGRVNVLELDLALDHAR